MTVRECLDRVRAIPGVVSPDEDMLLIWLSGVEGLIFEEIISGREGAPMAEFYGYGAEDGEKQLIAKDPYSEVYVYYVVAQLYLSYVDMSRYNSYLELYRDAYEEFAAYWARNHRQLSDVRFKR